MPYVKQEDRVKYAKIINQIYDLEKIETKGDLEYLVFALMKKFMSTRENRYSNLHEVVYAVMHCADEYRRRFLDKREDEAREINGDVE
jgi:hypothetical protein